MWQKFTFGKVFDGWLQKLRAEGFSISIWTVGDSNKCINNGSMGFHSKLPHQHGERVSDCIGKVDKLGRIPIKLQNGTSDAGGPQLQIHKNRQIISCICRYLYSNSWEKIISSSEVFIAVSNYLCIGHNGLIMTISGCPGEFRLECVQWIISESDILSSVRE